MNNNNIVVASNVWSTCPKQQALAVLHQEGLLIWYVSAMPQAYQTEAKAAEPHRRLSWWVEKLYLSVWVKTTAVV